MKNSENIFFRTEKKRIQLSLLISNIVGEGYFFALASFEKLKISWWRGELNVPGPCRVHTITYKGIYKLVFSFLILLAWNDQI